MYAVIMRDSLAILRQRWWAMLRIALVSIPVFVVIGLVGSLVIGKMVTSAATKATGKTVSSMQQSFNAKADAAGSNLSGGTTGAVADTAGGGAGATGSASDPITFTDSAGTKTAVSIPHTPVGLIRLLGPSAIALLLYVLVLSAIGAIVHAAMVRAGALDEGIGEAVRGAIASLRRLGAQTGVLQGVGLVGMLFCVLLNVALGGFGAFLGVIGEIAMAVVLVPLSLLVVADCALEDGGGEWLPTRSVRAALASPAAVLGVTGTVLGVFLVTGFLSALIIGLLLLPVVGLWSVALSVAMHQNLALDPPTHDDGFGGVPGGDEEWGAAGGGDAASGATSAYGAAMADPAAVAAVASIASMAPPTPAAVVEQPPTHVVLQGSTDPAGAASGGWVQVPAGGQATLQMQPAGAGLAVHVADAAGAWLATVPAVDANGVTAFPLTAGSWWINVGGATGAPVAWRLDAWLPAGSVAPQAAA